MLAKMGSTPDTSGLSQIFLTSHSPYLCNRDYVELYTVSIDDATGTKVTHGVEATRKLVKHFKYDDFNLSRRSELRK